MIRSLGGLAALGAAFVSFSTLAHVTVDQPTLPADSYVRIAIRVPHGCEGAATTGIRLQVPPELRGAKAMPLASWTLTSRKEGGVAIQGEHDCGAPIMVKALLVLSVERSTGGRDSQRSRGRRSA